MRFLRIIHREGARSRTGLGIRGHFGPEKIEKQENAPGRVTTERWTARMDVYHS